MATRLRWIAVLVLILIVIGVCLFLAYRLVRPTTPPGVVPPTPLFLEPRPPEVAAKSGLGPAPVSGTHYLHAPFAEGDCGACHAVATMTDPPRLSKDLWADVPEVCLSCHALEMEGDQLRPVQHKPFAEGKCIDCHDPHATDIPTLLRAGQPALCVSCHEEDGITQAPHVRDNPNNCLACHLPHSSFAEKLFPKPIARMCMDCHKNIVRAPDKPERHDKVAIEKACVACHDPHEGTVLDVARGQRCRDCHSEDIGLTTAAVSVHNGVREGRCKNCHAFHDRPELAAIPQKEFVLRQSPPDACLTCHSDIRNELRQPFIHKPLKEPKTEGVCDACHNTHTAPAPSLLAAPVPALCQECHKDIVPHAVGSDSPEARQARTECATCHTPHGSASVHLFKTSVVQTCETCHEKEVASFVAGPHKDEVEGQCTGCHSVHRSPDQPPVATETCAQCHDDVVNQIVSTKHGSLDNGCAACHTKHEGGTLKPTDPDRGCLNCHDGLRHADHPVSTASAATDTWHGQPLTCVSCHAPHGSGRRALVRLSGDALCLQCHGDKKPGQPLAAILLNSPHGTYSAGKTTCTGCHDFRPLQPGEIARDPNATCTTCHEGARTHANQPCAACHDPHATTANLKLIRQRIENFFIRFLAFSGRDSFVDLDGQSDDLCTACHTKTAYNNRLAVRVSHYEGQDCRKCHPHNQGFEPAPASCSVCHGEPPGSGAHLAHMNAGDASRITSCSTCHPAVTNWRQPGHRDGTVQMADGKPLGETTTCNGCHGNTASEAKTAWRSGGTVKNCLGCHNSQNPARIAGVTAPAVDRFWQQNGHGAAGIQLACDACHDPNAPHISGRLGDATRLKQTGDALCMQCHDGSKATAVSPHGNQGWARATQAPFSVSCSECHNPHGSSNRSMVRQRIRGREVIFTHVRGQDSYDEPDDANGDDLCATCHTTTAHNRVPSNRQERPHHEGVQCTSCHTHEADGRPDTADAFMPVRSCVSCHSEPQDNGDGVPPGGRRAVVAEFGKRTHHGQARDEVCLVCHDFSTHMSGQLALRRPDGGESIRGTAAADMDLTPFCQGCHDGDGATATFAPGGSPFDPFGDGSDLRRWAGLPFTVHSNENHIIASMEEPFVVSCQECHAGHGSDNRALVKEVIRGRPVTFTAVTGPNSFAIGDEGLCANCHVDMVSHRGGVHVPQNKDFSGTNCTTCHAHDRDGDPATLDGFAIGCGTRCHGQPPPAAVKGYPLNENELPHRSHVGVLGREGTELCRTCHLRTMETNQGHATEPRTFQDVIFDEFNPGATYDPATRTCANTACHSNGAPRGQALVSKPVSWQEGLKLGCDGCHGDASSLDTNAHRAHLQPQYTNRGANSITCATCHAATAADNTTIADRSKHVNGQKDVVVDETAQWGDPGQVIYDPQTATCANSRCHSDGAGSRETPGPIGTHTPKWDQPESGACGTCHAVSKENLTTGAHSFHLTFLGDNAPEACVVCHAPADAPTHVDGQVEFVDGKRLSETTACDTCHSAGGPFNGAAEAKANWATNMPVSCKGCHDAQPAVVLGVQAPDIYGDNTTYGFQVTGHRYLTCNTCHEDLELNVHIDGDPRTYKAELDNYRAAFGLKLGGLNVPRREDEIYSAQDASLCFTCHQEDNIIGLPEGYSNALSTHTQPPPAGYPLPAGPWLTKFINVRPEGYNMDNVPANIHWDHMDMNAVVWDSDGDGTWDSKPNCTTCHDPHGVRSVANGVAYPAQTYADMGIVHGVDPELGSYGELTRTDFLARCDACHKEAGIRYYR